MFSKGRRRQLDVVVFVWCFDHPVEACCRNKIYSSCSADGYALDDVWRFDNFWMMPLLQMPYQPGNTSVVSMAVTVTFLPQHSYLLLHCAASSKTNQVMYDAVSNSHSL